MARDAAGEDLTTTFAPGDTFYCLVQLANAPGETKVKAVWSAVEVQGVEPNRKIDEVEVATGSGPIQFNLTNKTGAWPTGRYKVDLYLDGKLDRTLEFSVE